jgi:hypothetical protein
MSSAVNKVLTSRVVTHTLSGTAAQLACYLAAVVVLLLGLWLVPGWVTTSRDMVFAILLLATVSLLLATLGSLSGLAATLKRDKIEQSE